MERKLLTIFVLLGLIGSAGFVFASTTNGTIDSTYKYAWSNSLGWINFGCDNCNVQITDSAITGYAWSQNYGWIKLNPSTSGVTNNNEGTLSGYAWGENTGWINFSGVTINSSGVFGGAASGDITGTISFTCDNCGVKTDWRPASTRGGGGGGLPSGAYSAPSSPTGGFSVFINNNAPYTETPAVTLLLKAGSDTARMAISNSPDFTNAVQEFYQNTKQWTLPEGDGDKTVYVKFFTAWGQPSEVVLDTIYLGKKTIIQQIVEIPGKAVEEVPKLPEKVAEGIKKIVEKIAEIIKPKEEKKLVFPPIEEVVKKEAPLAFQAKWKFLVTYTILNKPMTAFTQAPLPLEIRKLAEKFPELGETLKKVGITKIIDIEKLKTVKLTLLGLTARVGLPTIEIEPGKSALPKGVPLAKLSVQSKARIPTEIVFARTAAELVDFNITLSLTDKGQPEQIITTIVNKPLQLVVKPDKPVKSIKGYVVFKSKKPQPTSFKVPLESLTASLVFSNLDLTQPQTKPVEVEQELVLLEFEYTDPDGDGIYIANIQSPMVDGEYEIITVMDYKEPGLGPKAIRMVTIVDPEGYIYEKDGDKETRVNGAIVSLYWLNTETKQYELWPAKEYNQEDPQTTDVRGSYSFLVPEGYYYLKIEAPGYLVYDGKPFQVKEGSGIHFNIELKTKYWWLKLADWRTVLLVVVILLLLYNFYKDKLRDRIKNHNS